MHRWLPIHALTIHEAVQKAHEQCAPSSLLAIEETLQEIPLDEYVELTKKRDSIPSKHS